MNIADFDYNLPDELIARFPTEQRTASRLMVVDKKAKRWQHAQFEQLEQFLKPEDLLVFNNTKVIPARLFGKKCTGGKVELLVERIESVDTCLVHLKSSKSPKPGVRLQFEASAVQGCFEAEVLGRAGELFRLKFDNPILTVLETIGHIPLPPYIDREDQKMDRERYQTVYAQTPGAVAAPTAGLHFDHTLLAQLASRGIGCAYVTLHVGAGTFQPVRVDRIADHVMHSEWIELNQHACDKIIQTKQAGGRVIAVGTTSVRVLESAYKQGACNNEGGPSVLLAPFQGDTDIFIYPGFKFHIVDAMITNFHLPRSTLLMLVSAFSGQSVIKSAYQAAIEAEYRFFSYGDAMLLV